MKKYGPEKEKKKKIEAFKSGPEAESRTTLNLNQPFCSVVGTNFVYCMPMIIVAYKQSSRAGLGILKNNLYWHHDQ